MTAAHNTGLVRRMVEDVWNRGDLALADVLVAPGYVNHGGLIPQKLTRHLPAHRDYAGDDAGKVRGMFTDTAHIRRVIEQLSEGWRAGDGTHFAASFAPHAHFVAFDGSVLTGPGEIASFHQRAFDSHLRGTELAVAVQEIRLVDPTAWLVFATGGIRRKDGSVGELTGESVQMFLCKRDAGVTLIEAFQNTRIRPVTDTQSAEVWQTFDTLWETRTT